MFCAVSACRRDVVFRLCVEEKKVMGKGFQRSMKSLDVMQDAAWDAEVLHGCLQRPIWPSLPQQKSGMGVVHGCQRMGGETNRFSSLLAVRGPLRLLE